MKALFLLEKVLESDGLGENNQNWRESISTLFFSLVYSKFLFYHLKKLMFLAEGRQMTCLVLHIFVKRYIFQIKSRHTGTALGLICPLISLCDDPT